MSDEAGHVVLMINGEQRSFTPESRTLLVQLLRDGCGLTGTKIGCDTGQCGACTVLVGGRALKSCMLLAVSGWMAPASRRSRVCRPLAS